MVLVTALAGIVGFGTWRTRKASGMNGYLRASRTAPWHLVALSVMATQASAITFLSTPGQAYEDGMRFVQFYFGLPLAMVVLSVTFVPAFHRMNVYTAYEFLEGRFDLKTRTLAASLFLLQRGLATGLTIYAPAVVLSVLLSWPVSVTTVLIGVMVVLYTATGGSRAVAVTQRLQFTLMMGGLALAVVVVVRLLPPEVSFSDAVAAAGAAGRMNVIETRFDPGDRYNLWSGLLGGFFLSLSYFGTDQSQVGRYLAGRSVTESRLGLLFNGLAKVPMQFGILFVGILVFVFHQFVLPPVYFNPVETARVRAGPLGPEFARVERDHANAFTGRRAAVRSLLLARRAGNAAGVGRARAELRGAEDRFDEVRARAVELVKRANPGSAGRDVNYVFLGFVLERLPAGLVGLILAAVFCAAMSSASAELSALATTSVVDVWRRLLAPGAPDERVVLVSRLATVFWAVVAVGFARFAGRFGTLVEAVNVLGSLFYGTILGVFVVAFYLKRVGGNAVFAAAVAAEAVVLGLFASTRVSFLWFNVIGCLLVVVLSAALQAVVATRATTA